LVTKFKNNTKEVKKMLAKNIFNALDAVGFFVEGEAKRKVPVDKGYLRDSFGHEVDDKKNNVRVGNFLPYAVFVEKGTGIFASEPSKGTGKTSWVYYDVWKDEFVFTYGQKPQPFLMPAIENNREKIVKIIALQLKKGFEWWQYLMKQ